MSEVEGKIKNSTLIIENNFKYYLSSTNKLTAYCALRSKKCRAKLNFIDGKWRSDQNAHNHEASETNFIEKKRAEDEIVELCRTSMESHRKIFDQVCERYDLFHYLIIPLFFNIIFFYF